jgi:hypothetical protein
MTPRRRGATNLALGLVLGASFFGFTATGAHALSISGTYTAPVNFSLSADDHAFLFVDGKLVLDDGGIKPLGGGITTTFSVTGSHTLDLFFADVRVEKSGITFSCEGCADPTSTAPEPATLVLFGTTLVGIGTVIRRHLKGRKKGA